MPIHRKVILALCLLLVVGSLSVSIGYAVYLRSGTYKQSIEADVTNYLKLATQIERVEPLSRDSRRFHGIRVLMADNETEVFHCEQALWRQTENGDGLDNILKIKRGFVRLDSRYNVEDYQALRAGFTHDYRELDLSAVHLHDIDVAWRQPGFEFLVGSANGVVTFDRDGMGRATLTTHKLNSHHCDMPVHIEADFTTGPVLDVRRLTVRAPRIALASLSLDDVLGSTVTGGWFEGTFELDQTNEGRRCRIRGALGESLLEQFTARLSTGRLRGSVDVAVEDAVVVDRRLERLSFNGTLAGIHLADVAPLFDQPNLDGQVNINVQQATYDDGKIKHLTAGAEARDVSLEALTRIIGRGVITGQLRVTVDSLVVTDDRLRWADIRIDAVPPPGGKGTIERQLILDVAKEALNIDLGRGGKLLPAQVGYARLGCRLVIDNDELRVMGTHGKDNRTMLTIRVLGREIGLINAPDRTYRIRDVIGEIREKLAGYDADVILDWLQEKSGVTSASGSRSTPSEKN